jgi:hypothetical protein
MEGSNLQSAQIEDLVFIPVSLDTLEISQFDNGNLRRLKRGELFQAGLERFVSAYRPSYQPILSYSVISGRSGAMMAICALISQITDTVVLKSLPPEPGMSTG